MKKSREFSANDDEWRDDLSKMILSDEEASVFTEEYLTTAIEEAMQSIRRVEALWRAPFSQVLPLRDMLLARYLLGSGVGAAPLDKVEVSNLPQEASLGVPELLLDEARTFERLSQFAAEKELGVPEYVRLLTMVAQLPEGYSALPSDHELEAMVVASEGKRDLKRSSKYS